MTAAAAAVPHASTTTTGRNKRKQPCSTSRSNSGDNNAYQAAYAGFTFEPVRPAASEGCLLPGTLHSLFKDTYAVSYKHCRSAAAAAADGTKEGVGDDDDEHCKHADSAVAGGTGQQQMRVHQHANGLCVVTVGDALRRLDLASTAVGDTGDWTIRFQASETPATSAAQKRKRGAKQLQGKKLLGDAVGAVRPSDALVTMEHQNHQQQHRRIELPCCVFGSVLELNRNVTMDLLQTDPLLRATSR
jgi:hypothetical protein